MRGAEGRRLVASDALLGGGQLRLHRLPRLAHLVRVRVRVSVRGRGRGRGMVRVRGRDKGPGLG